MKREVVTLLTRVEVRRAVVVQALVIVALGVAVGLPVGLVAG